MRPVPLVTVAANHARGVDMVMYWAVGGGEGVEKGESEGNWSHGPGVAVLVSFSSLEFGRPFIPRLRLFFFFLCVCFL